MKPTFPDATAAGASICPTQCQLHFEVISLRRLLRISLPLLCLVTPALLCAQSAPAYVSEYYGVSTQPFQPLTTQPVTVLATADVPGASEGLLIFFLICGPLPGCAEYTATYASIHRNVASLSLPALPAGDYQIMTQPQQYDGVSRDIPAPHSGDSAIYFTVVPAPVSAVASLQGQYAFLLSGLTSRQKNGLQAVGMLGSFNGRWQGRHTCGRRRYQ